MLTLREAPKRIVDTRDFKGHAFFEASFIRKIDDNYYFIFSSQKNHELCYAVSHYPDRDLSNVGNIAVTARGQGILQILFDDVVMGELSFCCSGWEKMKIGVSGGASHSTVSLMIQQGKLDIISFAVEE